MTDKQKKAIKILNELWYVSRNDGLAKLSDENYYLLLEVVLDNNKYHNDYPTDKPWENYTMIRDRTPLAQCYTSEGICTNPFHDCIGCPKQFGGGNYTTPTDLKEEKL
jgi:hypothetical protein